MNDGRISHRRLHRLPSIINIGQVNAFYYLLESGLWACFSGTGRLPSYCLEIYRLVAATL